MTRRCLCGCLKEAGSVCAQLTLGDRANVLALAYIILERRCDDTEFICLQIAQQPPVRWTRVGVLPVLRARCSKLGCHLELGLLALGPVGGELRQLPLRRRRLLPEQTKLSPNLLRSVYESKPQLVLYARQDDNPTTAGASQLPGCDRHHEIKTPASNVQRHSRLGDARRNPLGEGTRSPAHHRHS